MDIGRIVIYILVVLVLIYCLYLLWLWINDSSDYQDMVIYSSMSDGLPAKTKTTGQVFTGTQVPQIYPGGEYSISTWIYVTNWGSGGTSTNKPFLVLTSGGQLVTLVMYLGQTTNKLGIRVSDNINNSIKITDIESKIIPALSPYSDSQMLMCDIEEVNIQRWVNITVVMMGKTVDVYIDGKLSRSSVLPGLFAADGDIPSLTLGNPNGFGGIIGLTRGANIAYTPDRVYALYQQGPFAGWSLSSLNPMSKCKI
jgi:hypothetical protein